jgi:polysaccharide biosynthesis transport protein
MNDIERYGLRPNVAAALQADTGVPEEKINLGELLHVLRKRKATILGLTAGTIALTAVLTLIQHPIYEAKTQILVQINKQAGLGSMDKSMPLLSSMMPDVGGFGAARSVGTEVEVLRSDTMVDRAIVEADSPQIQVLRAAMAERERQRNAILGSRDPSATVLADLDSRDREAQEQIDEQAGKLVDERRRILSDPRAELPVKDPKLKVESVKDTDVIGITVDDRDPIRAQNVANSMTAIYVNQNRHLNSASARKARQFVEAQMEDVKKELSVAERQLKDFKEHARTADMAEETKQAITRLTDLGVQQRAAESEQKGLEASVADYRRQLANTPVRLQAATVTTIHNPVIAQLESSVAALEVQRAGLLKEYQPDSPEVRQVDAQLQEANARIGKEMDRVVGERTEALNPVYQKLMEEFVQAEAARVAIAAKVNGLKQAVAEGKAELSQLPSRALRLAELTRNAAVLDRTYNLMNEKYQELRVSEAAQIANARIVDVATKPSKPVRPNKPMNMALGLSFGLLLGLAIAFLQEHLDNSVKTPDQIEREFGLPTLGMLGDMREGEDRVISKSRPQAALAEALRMVRASLQFASVDGQLQSLLVTSAVPGEGKSTIAANLALVMAQKGLRVVLVDADMRSPRQHRIFELPNTTGLSSVIVGQTTIEDAAYVHPDSNLMILTSGPMPPNPAELLESSRARDLVEQLKASCDMVIFDSPPCTTMVDGSALAAQVDGAILVVRAGHTPRIAVARACQVLRETGTRLLGTILNRVNAQTDQYYYTYYYRYYYSNYGEPEEQRRPALTRSGSRGGGNGKEDR